MHSAGVDVRRHSTCSLEQGDTHLLKNTKCKFQDQFVADLGDSRVMNILTRTVCMRLTSILFHHTGVGGELSLEE